MSSVKVFQPGYFKNFICTGTKCVNNCCVHNWQIRIDQNTYNKYKELGDAGIEILEKIKVVTQEPFLALMLKNDDCRCNFLNNKGLCHIQLTHGYDYLSRTCRIHPRNISYINGEFETFLELSCEESARVVLFGNDHLDFEEGVLEPDGSGNYIPNHILTPEKYTSARDGFGIFSKLRSASVAILQSRQYKVRVRMMILCLFIQQVADQLAAGNDENIPLFTQVFIDALRENVYDGVAEELPDGIDLDFSLAMNILREMASKNDKRFNSILKQALDGFALSKNNNDNVQLQESYELPDNFSTVYKEYFTKYLSDNESVLENYIVNYILMFGFPFNFKKDTDIMSNYAVLLANYNLVEFLLTGICSYHKEFNEWNIIDCVSAFCRCYENSLKGYLMYE